MSGDELQFVDWLTRRQTRHSAVRFGIGDDMAVIEPGDATVLISSDMLLDGVHFDTTSHALERIGRKAIACSLSDCAAMAVQPIAVTVSLALPQAMSQADAKRLYEGMFAIGSEFDLAIAGGDTTRWDHPLAIDVAILARPFPGIAPVTRSGARLGDRLYVTGPLGGSILGKHLDFVPRVKEAELLARTLGARLHAMIDVSDGLSLDLWRICQASHVGATLDESQLQAAISDAAKQLAANDGKPPLDHALSDGEDFELLLAVEGEVTDAPIPIIPIGSITKSQLQFRRLDGTSVPLEPKGYIH